MELHFELERMLEAKLLFGLAVRFFGVFAVLILLMVILYATGWFFSRYMTGEKKTPQGQGEGASPAASTTEKPVQATDASPAAMEAPVSGEVAAAIALGIRESAGSLAASGFPVAGEVAAAVAMALSAHPGAHLFPLQHYGTMDSASRPSGGDHQESPWKLLGRQEAISRNNPWTGRRRTDRETTNREPKV